MTARSLYSVCLLFVLVLLGTPDGDTSFAQELKQETTIETRTRTIAQKLRCPVCQSQSIYDSNAPLAAQMLDNVRAMVSEGRSESDIVSFFTDKYGNYVLMAPPMSGIHRFIWFLPLVLITIGSIVVAGFVRARQRMREKELVAAQGDLEHIDIERMEI